MNGIRVVCYTNLDSFKGCVWPTRLPAVPSVGHRVESADGKALEIVGLTWTQDALGIELHRAGGAL